MIIDSKKTKWYLLHEFANGKVALCRVLNEYNSRDIEEANDGLINLVTDNTTEEEILAKYAQKDIFNGIV